MEISAEILERRTSLLIGLSDQDVADRRNHLGASDAPIILGGDEAKIYQLWQVKIGDAEAEDLSRVLAVQMGTWTEDLNLRWFEQETGCRVFGRREKVIHPRLPWLRATLDGRTTHPENNHAAVVDAKHVGPFNYDAENTLSRYAPQVAVQMACTEVDWGLLSIFSGNAKWEWIGMQRDLFYEAQVLAALTTFWQHVQDKTPPVDIPQVTVPANWDDMRSVDMSLSNAWINFEADYLTHEDNAKLFEAAKSGMKELIEADVKEAKGRQLICKRGKTGSLRFSKVK